ncbi:MAG: GWxTD domain-containing protein [candidate division KSB1 bacterium]|nr:GWxTD domain-containing protein [candidate division KSB1 bacterium]MDZ7347399.1 GWxTD domain-containing protein [candidate division KSB1 bacterium]MDZ7394744.1 GWxTD domain-containing protein [candidate division KSB1 bacterium]MDZ7408165.1 GWxTD domain-containing protein [candidate division KSB1 bacterium]MDZ7415050.1 GWxTD domain-containing protein [candidate division KSB1 bacterium]
MILLITLLLLLLPLTGGEAQPGKRERARQLLQKTLADRPGLALSDLISRLEKVTRLDGGYAEAHYQLGLARQQENTIRSRRAAAAAFQRAIALQPRNPEYRYRLALLQHERGFDGEAKRQFQQMMKIAPADPRPYYHLALYRERDMLHYREMVSLHENATLSFHEFAQQDFEEARRLLETALALDPNMQPARQRLAALLFEVGRYDEMAAVLQAGLGHDNRAAGSDSARAELYLWLGLAHTRRQDTQAAAAAFATALALLPPEQRAFFSSLTPVLSPAALESYLSSDTLRQRQQERDFWQARDPLFLTAANERLLEHFSRVAYANLRYGIPEKGLAGWQTDRGRVLIRFGFPCQRLRTRADLGTTATGHVTLNASKEVWDYGSFHMIFDDRFLNGNYSFAWSWNPEGDGKVLYERQIEREAERYDFPHGGKPLALPHVIAQFRAPNRSDSTLLEIYYGLFSADLQPAAIRQEQRQYQLARGFFLCSADWVPRQSWRQDRKVLTAPAGTPGGQEVLIERWTITAPPGTYKFSLETLDLVSRRSGVVRDEISIEDFSGDRLAVSPILLAEAVEPAGEGLAMYNKGELSILPSLSHRFRAQAPIYIYYEIYNLSRDESGATSFRIETTVERDQAARSPVAGAVQAVSRLLGLGRQPVVISSAFEARGTSSQENLHHSIQVLEARPGKYRLTLTVTDLPRGQRATHARAFELF